MTRNRQTYWYKMFIGECPVCGRDASYRIKQCGPKPSESKEIYVILSNEETYDHCLEREAM